MINQSGAGSRYMGVDCALVDSLVCDVMNRISPAGLCVPVG